MLAASDVRIKVPADIMDLIDPCFDSLAAVSERRDELRVPGTCFYGRLPNIVAKTFKSGGNDCPDKWPHALYSMAALARICKHRITVASGAYEDELVHVSAKTTGERKDTASDRRFANSSRNGGVLDSWLRDNEPSADHTRHQCLEPLLVLFPSEMGLRRRKICNQQAHHVKG